MTRPEPADFAEQDRLLAQMLAAAERLCQTDDVMLTAQYHHLRARIDALIELRRVAGHS